MDLLQLESVLMSMGHIATEDHTDSQGLGHRLWLQGCTRHTGKRAMLTWVAHTVIQRHDVTRAGAGGPTETRVCIDVHVPCYHQGPCGRLGSCQSPETTSASEKHTTVRAILIWVAVTWGHGYSWLGLLPRAMSGSVILQWLGSCVASVAPVTTEDSIIAQGLVSHWGPGYHQDHTDLDDLCFHWGHDDLQVKANAEGYVWVCDPTAVGIYDGA